MRPTRRRILAAAAGLSFRAGAATAQLASTLRIGALTDLAGSAGQGSGAARLAGEDVGGAVRGARIEALAGHSQTKPDIALNIARQWLDQEGVAAIVDLPCSSGRIGWRP